VSRYDEAGSSNSGNDSGFRNVNGSLDGNSSLVNRATDSTRGTTPAIGNFHIIHPYFSVPSFNFYNCFYR